MSIFGGGGGGQATMMSNKPWKPLRDNYIRGYNRAEGLFKRGAPGYFPGSAVAPMSGYTRGALDSMATRASQGSDLTRSAQGQLTNTLSGDYLNAGNPYFQGAVQSATRPVIDAYNKQVMPGIDSNFSAAGRYGSGAHALASSDAGNNMMTQVGDISSQMAYNNYSDERQNQIRGMLFAPELANQDYNDINALGRAGEGIDNFNQAKLDSRINRYNYNQNKDWNYLSDYIGLLNGSPYRNSTTSMQQPRPNIFTAGLGGAMTGASIGSMIPGVGTGLGALGGGALGLLGSMF